MPSHRGHQKKLEKKKKQRLAAQSAARAGSSTPTQKAIERLAASSPFGPAFMSESWKQGDPASPSLVSVIVSRKLPDGSLVAAMCLVDRTCLGIKNAYITSPLSRVAFEDMVAQTAEAHEEGVSEVSVLEAQSVIFNALDYAATLGFSPNKDFSAALVGPRPETLLETPLARPERPCFMPGEDDDVARIVRVLTASVGEGGFALGNAGA